MSLCFICHADNSCVVMRTTFGDIIIELFQTDAPITVENFLHYVTTGFYDETCIHRVDNNSSFSIIQGGGYNVIGYTIYIKTPDREPIVNESYNGLSNLRGTIAMARTTDPDSATSQFFINHEDNTLFDKANYADGYGYCVFGRVIHGMDVVNIIANSPNYWISQQFQNFPIPVITIQRVFELPDGFMTLDFKGTGHYLLEADFNYSGIVDNWDLRTLADRWLTEDTLGDMPVDGIINFPEFAGLAKSWQRTSVWKRVYPADINYNNKVNFKDYALLVSDWGKEGTELYGDINLDGTVDYADIAYLADDWLK